MDYFLVCFAFTLGAEGGYSTNPADPGNWTGGAIGRGEMHGTKFGISAAAYPKLAIATLTEDAAEQIYRQDYWQILHGDELPLPLGLAAFDAAVNAGPRQSVIWLQQAANVPADGILGPASLAALQTGDAVLLAREALARRIDYSARLPSWQNFGLGWSRRLISLAAEISRQ